MNYEINLKDLILNLIKFNHRGKNKAIKRRELLLYCRQIDPSLSDRELRRIVEELSEICTSPKGYFMPENMKEVDETIEYLRKKALALLQRAKRIEEHYKSLFDSSQRRLFI